MSDGRRVFVFGPFRFDADDLTLSRHGKELPLQAKPARLLLVLLEHAGNYRTTEQLLEEAWPDASVSIANVSQQVSVIRKALAPKRYVESRTNYGYKFVGLEKIDDTTASSSAVPPLQSPENGSDAGSVLPAVERLQAASNRVQRDGANADTRKPSIPSSRNGTRIVLIAVAAALVVLTVLIARPWAEPPVATIRLGEPRRLTSDRQFKSQVPLLVDDHHIIYAAGARDARMVLPLGGGSPHRLFPESDKYTVEDLHADRSEYLVRRISDVPGDDQLLSVIPMATGPPREIPNLRVQFASWSPDARQFIVVRRERLEIVGEDGALIRFLPLPRSDGSPQWPRWSPDGQTIAFVWSTHRVREGPDESLWLVQADGSRLRQAPFSGETGRADGPVAWTPDSQWLIYHSRYGDVTELRAIAMRALEERLVVLTRGERNFAVPAVSSDGRTLYAVGWSVHSELVRIDRAGNQVLGPSGISGTWVSYSPTGEIAFVSYPDKKLWIANGDGTNPRQLVPGPFEVDGAAWAPDGQTIAFQSRTGGSPTRIHLVSPSGDVRSVISEPPRAHGLPSFAPNSRRLVFGEVPPRFGEPAGAEALWIHDLDGGTTTEIPGSRGLWTARWSPDDRWIAAIEIAAPRRLRLLEIATGKWQVVPRAANIDDLQWTRDSRSIVYRTQGGDPMLARVAIAGGLPERILDLKTFGFAPDAYGWFGLTPADEPLLLRNPSAPEIYAFPILR